MLIAYYDTEMMVLAAVGAALFILAIGAVHLAQTAKNKRVLIVSLVAIIPLALILSFFLISAMFSIHRGL